jgi:uncharacterized protein (TIGR00297 family)
MHNTERQTFGTVYYPAAVTFLILICWDQYKPALAAGVLVMAISDALAALVGRKTRHPHIYFLSPDKKSMEGSAAMFLSALMVIGYVYNTMLHRSLFDAGGLYLTLIVFTALLATVVEAVSSKGFDNLTVPLTVAWMFSFQMSQDAGIQVQFLHGVMLSAIVSYLTVRLKFLTLSGACGSFLLGTVIFGIGGWIWSLPILVFFITSSVLSKMGRRRKQRFHSVFEKGSTRDFGQVMANGAIPGFIVLVYYFIPDDRLYLVYCGVLAAVTSDTWATEIGTWAGGTVRHVLTFQKIEIGTSGGVSLAGTLGGVIGAAFIAVSGYFSNELFFVSHSTVSLFSLIIFAGVSGSGLDSILGATVQSQYRCHVCGKITERIMHCNNESLLIRGHRYFHNDSVNVLCGGVGGMVIMIVSF